MNNTKKLVYTANFVALGVLIPLFTTHIIGVPGGILSPMHIPVFLCGFVCGWYWGLLCGVLSPALSSLLTGMPPSWPLLPVMIVELALYGAISGLLFGKFKLPIYISLPAAMIAGRIGYGLMFVILTSINPDLMLTGVWAAIVTGLPGIAIQILLIPAIVGAMNLRPEKQKTTKDTE